jgi:hypothetical protein
VLTWGLKVRNLICYMRSWKLHLNFQGSSNKWSKEAVRPDFKSRLCHLVTVWLVSFQDLVKPLSPFLKKWENEYRVVLKIEAYKIVWQLIDVQQMLSFYFYFFTFIRQLQLISGLALDLIILQTWKTTDRGDSKRISTVEINHLLGEKVCPRQQTLKINFMLVGFCFPIRNTTQFSCRNSCVTDTVEMGTLRQMSSSSCPGRLMFLGGDGHLENPTRGQRGKSCVTGMKGTQRGSD